MELHPLLLKDLLQLHQFQIGTKAGLRNEGILFYIYKKMLEEFLEETERKIKTKRKQFRGSSSLVKEIQLEKAREFLERIDNVLKEFPTLKEIVYILEKENLMEKILQIIEASK